MQEEYVQEIVVKDRQVLSSMENHADDVYV